MEKEKKKTEKEKMEKEKNAEIAEAECNDKNCHIHGSLKLRGKTFEGKVIKKSHKRITIEFERMIYIRKYERYAKSRTKIHARLPICMDKDINIGDSVKIQECRPLSKIIHFAVVEKLNDLKKEK